MRFGTVWLALACLLHAALRTQAQAPESRVRYELRPGEQGRFSLEVYKSKLWEGRKHVFVFDRYHGLLLFDRERPEASSIEFSVVSASARCVDDWVKPGQIEDIEEAARKTMGADRYPEIRFRSTAIQARSGNEYEVRGMLTIRDRTEPVVLRVTAAPMEDRLRLTGSGPVKLSDFGLKPPRGAVFLFIGTKDEMTVQFDVVASR
jgi:polyisoprenoid-binding protein YceI